MAEEKKPGKRNDLTSKIAAAYGSVPTENREQTLHKDEEVQNPELDRAFEKMVESYKTKRPDPRAVVQFPRGSRAPAEEIDEEGSDGGQECPECGHINPAGNRFCGECGAAKDDAVALQRRRENESEVAAISTESGIKHHHHYYHHHHYRNNPFLLVAIVLLLALIAWQQWQEYQRTVAAPGMAGPAAGYSQPGRPAATTPEKAPATPVATPAPAPTTAAPRATKAKPSRQPAGNKKKATIEAATADPSLRHPANRPLPELVPPAKVTPTPPKQ